MSFRFWLPLTTPSFLMKDQGVCTLPPLQPLFSALKQMSSALNGSLIDAFVAGGRRVGW